MNLLWNIVFTGLIISGFYMAIKYTHIAWRLAEEKENQKKLSLYAMFYGFGATFAFLLSIVIKEPLAKEFLPHFFIFSIIMGITLRDSAMRPIKSAEFWSKILSQIKQNSQSTEVTEDHKK